MNLNLINYDIYNVAVSDIKFLFEQCAMKVGVKQRGCNGMTYTLEFSDSKARFDEEVEQDGKFQFAINK